MKGDGVAITQRDPPDHVRLSDTLWRDRQLADEPIVLDEFLLEIERRLLERAMARSGGNKTKARTYWCSLRPVCIADWSNWDSSQNSDEEQE